MRLCSSFWIQLGVGVAALHAGVIALQRGADGALAELIVALLELRNLSGVLERQLDLDETRADYSQKLCQGFVPGLR